MTPETSLEDMRSNPFLGYIPWHQGWHIVETEDGESFDLLVILNANDELVCELHTHAFGVDSPQARQQLEAIIFLAESAE